MRKFYEEEENLYVNLLKKRKENNSFSTLDQQKLLLCQELLLGQITFDYQIEFLNPIRAFLNHEINQAQLEYYILIENEVVNQKLLQYEESLLIPKFRNGICELINASTQSDFNAMIMPVNKLNLRNKSKFIQKQQNKPEHIQLGYADFVEKIYNSIL